MTEAAWSKPALAVGDFVVMSGETFAAAFRRPFAWRELIEQVWFVAKVSIVPTLVLSIPYTVLIVFTLNIVLIEVGAGDLSGAGAAWVMAAPDPVGCWGAKVLMEQRYGLGITVITGPATDNEVGRDYVNAELGIPAFNARREPEALVEVVRAAMTVWQAARPVGELATV